MDVAAPLTDERSVAHQHENGQRLEAPDAKSAAAMCPFLGKMSLEEVGLLLELQTIGNDTLATKPDAESEKPDTVVPEYNFFKTFEKPEAAGSVSNPRPSHVQSDNVDTVVSPTISIETEFFQENSRVAQAHSMISEMDNLLTDGILERNNHNAETVTKFTDNHNVRVVVSAPTARTAFAATVHADAESKPSINKVIRPIEKPPALVKKAVKVSSGIKTGAATPLKKGPTKKERKEKLPVSLSHDLPVTPQEIIPETEFLVGQTQETSEFSETSVLTSTEFEPQYDTEPTVLNENYISTEPLSPIYFEPSEMHLVIPELIATLEQSDELYRQQTHDIIQEIVNLPVSLDELTTGPEEASEQELEELFTALFEKHRLNCSPKLLKKLVLATHTRLLKQTEAQMLDNDKDIQEMSRAIGTREFLQQTQQRNVNAKATRNKLASIGRSILRLYSSAMQGAGS